MNHDQQNFNTWNKVAKIYEDKFMCIDLYNETYDFVCNAIDKENAKVLEIGCGPGNITKYLLNKRPDLHIHGIDLAPNMIELAEKNNPTASFAVMDAREIGELDTKFDAIIAGFCIPYFSPTECEQFIVDAKHLLNEHGLIYISFVEGAPSQSKLMTNKNGDSVYFNYHELATLKGFLKEIGSIDTNVFKVDFKRSANESEIHTVLIAKTSR